jgi:uncharacterized protein YecE (DUF72 family)
MARRTPPSSQQLELFGSSTPDAVLVLERRFERLAALAARLPAQVHFGTSSWSFPGWAGIVYPPGMTEGRLAREGLPLYVRHPLMRTVGIDRGYYAPLGAEDLLRYGSQLPAGFLGCAKAPELFTCPVSLGHGRGQRGEPNPDFLDSDRFLRLVAAPMLSAFSGHAGPLILEFPPVPPAHRISALELAERLDAFLQAMPPQLQFAVELRDPTLLTAEYARVLARHGASHTYNYWSGMPMPLQQAQVVSPGQAPFIVVRLMLPPGTRYQDRKQAFAPFDRLLDPNPEMRAQVLELARLAHALGRAIFVLVNNKAEGSAPLTIEALAAAWVAEPESLR